MPSRCRRPWRWLAGGALVALTGCSLLPGPGREQAPTTYVLAPAPASGGPTVVAGDRPVLLVAMPQADPGYGSSQIAYAPRPYALSYYARSQWLDTPPRMLRPALVAVLERTGRFGAVVTEPSAALAQFRLDTEIVELVHALDTEPDEGRVTLRAQLTELATRRVIATRTVQAAEPLPESTPYGAVLAINRALQRAVNEIAGFCAHAFGETRQP